MIKKVGNIDFNVENVKKMSYEQFKTTYKGVLDKVDIDEAYTILTGKKPEKPKKVVKATKKDSEK